MLLKWVGFLYLGWAASHWIKGANIPALILVAAAVVASADANPYVLVLVVAAWCGFATAISDKRLQYAISFGIVLLAMFFQLKYGIDEQALRAVVAVGILALTFIIPWKKSLGLGAAAVFTLAALSITVASRHQGILGLERFSSQYVWSDLDADNFNIARAAKNLSPSDAIWVVPPNFEVFYSLAERPVVVNFTAVPFEDSAILEWRTRLENIYGPTSAGGFGALNQMTQQYKTQPRLGVAAQIYGARYAVLYSETPWDGAVLAENDSFKAVRIPQD